MPPLEESSRGGYELPKMTLIPNFAVLLGWLTPQGVSTCHILIGRAAVAVLKPPINFLL
jgi:hypothetical protein